jgi:hypothetical protein
MVSVFELRTSIFGGTMHDLPLPPREEKKNLHGLTVTHEHKNRSGWNPIFMPDKLHRVASKSST